ncbi:hypothetical protein V8G61_13490 [Gaetbulibacter sp. M240]|uniref:type IX secretion system periplasmic lipoprotein PorW/SprE n=1 Tax=Gaetbulibacter sp. M240 TaxID=3126511 RepID=UPI00374FA78F
MSRNFHAVTAEYNALFNGYNALEEGRMQLNSSYADNYWGLLPIERMQIDEDILLPGQARNENFTRAEEKATKAIQKHGMNIDGKEKNPQMDEAYLLLGKARYFDQRFIPSLEAFNYILYKYPASDKINQAKIWREKANIRLDNNELAIENLKRLLRVESLDGQDLADATSILAQAYINTKVIDTAITQLGVAAKATKSNDERGRFRFIQGQLYNQLGYKDSANIAFDKVIELNRRTPRIYMISAYLEKIKNFDLENGNKLTLEELLDELEENRENRPFLDKIYHGIANYRLRNEQDSTAIVYFNKSLRTDSNDRLLKAKNYETLGDMNFDASVYEIAGAYYDSTMLNLKDNSKAFRLIKRKRDNLEDVILYEGIAQTNDSILKLVKMPDAERLAYFEAFVADLKAKTEAAESEKSANANANTGIIGANNPVSNRSAQQSAGFYFYNPTLVAYGKNEFIKVWGNRPLEDNWRWSKRTVTAQVSEVAPTQNIVAQATAEEKFDPQFYLARVPSEPKELDSIKTDRNYAYYQLGLIYREKFNELERAKTKFLDLLSSDPAKPLILPSKYNLYKIYEALGEQGEADVAKADIITNYPASRYANILLNPDLVAGREENSPERIYETLYEKHEQQNYAEVISESEKNINTFNGDPMVPKFELLKATALGRLKGFEAYKTALSQVAVNYANTEEGKQAQYMLTSVLPNLESTEFSPDTEDGSYYVVFQFDTIEREAIPEFKKNLDEILENLRKYYDLSTSVDVYTTNTTFLVVHGFKNKQVAQTFDQLLAEYNEKKIKRPYFYISADNYQIVQIHKNIDQYLTLKLN